MMPRALAGMLLLFFSGTQAIAESTMPRVPPGFTIERIATVAGARELAVTRSGDLLVGGSGSRIAIVRNASGTPSGPEVFVDIDDAPTAGIAIAPDAVYVGGQFSVWRIPFNAATGAHGHPQKIASVRTSGISRDHITTSLAYGDGKLSVAVGSSCDACQPELDDTRATITQMNPDGSSHRLRAIHIRNAIALAINPATGTLWAGVAEQDALPRGHPYEIFDSVSSHAGVADYGWPYCYDNRVAVGRNDCSHVVEPRVVFPAYATPIGAAFYPKAPTGPYAFPRRYWGGAFVSLHGSWHLPRSPPLVAFVPLRADRPEHPVNWNDPSAQWSEFVNGMQDGGGRRIARPTGVAVAPSGDLFVADDDAGAIYRIRARH